MIKRLMIIATILWPIGMVLTGISVFWISAGHAVTSNQTWIPLPNGNFDERGDVIRAGAFSGAVAGLACPSILYGMAIVGLLVLRYATRKDHA